MDYSQAKSSFIDRWGEMGPRWGINRTMGQIHAYLLISSESHCSDEIMKALDISRGSTCMNLKALVEWGLIYKECVDGCRKEYYVAEKDMYKVFRQIVIHRKTQELDPLVQMMEEFSDVKENCNESSEFCKVIKDINYFSSKASSTLDTLLEANPDWFVGGFLRMIK